MGEAKRRKKESFSDAQIARLEALVGDVYKRARSGLAAAKAAADDEGRRAAIVGIHADSVGLVGTLTDELDRKSTRLNSSHSQQSRMPSSA